MIVVIQSNVGGFAPGDRVEFDAGAEGEAPLSDWLAAGWATEATDLSAQEAQDGQKAPSGTEGAGTGPEDQEQAGGQVSGQSDDDAPGDDAPKPARGSRKRA